ncbi:MAG: SIP domain-containing protein [Actinomycetota bacterium]
MADAPTVTGFTPEIGDDVQYVMEHLQGNHADTLVFIAQHGPPGVRSATDVTVTDVDPGGLTMLVTDGGGASSRRIDFGDAVNSMSDLQGQMLGLLSAARAASPDSPQTSIEREMAASASLETRIAVVTAVRPLTPSLMEITLGGGEGGAGLTGLPVHGGDEFFYLMVPSLTAPTVFDDLDDDAELSMASLAELAGDEEPHGAYYTSRRRRPDSGELDVWIVRHGAVGVAGWAERASPGDRVALWGPRVAYEPPDGTTSHLLVADESGLAAVAAIIDGLDPEHRVIAVLEVGSTADAPPFPERASISTHWVERGAAAPGTSGRLLAAVADLPIDVDGVYAFGAAESREISAVRRYLRHERGMAHEQVHMTGYWRREASHD